MGTVVSTHKVTAVVAMAVVGFCVLFLGIVSPQVATASTAALLLFVLPVAVAQPAAAIGPRLLGWAFAAVFCVHCLHGGVADPLARQPAPSAVGDRVGRGRAGRRPPDGRIRGRGQRGRGVGGGAVAAPVGRHPVPGDRCARRTALALAKLVGRVEWVAGNAALSGARPSSLEIPAVRAMIETVAETLRRCAALICDGTAHPVHDPERRPPVAGIDRGGWPNWWTPRSTTRCPA